MSEDYRMILENNQRVEKSWFLFVMMVTKGEAPDKAIEQIEAAMEAWKAYEDVHLMKLPEAVVLPASAGYGEFPDKTFPAPANKEYYVLIPKAVPGDTQFVKAIESAPNMPMVFELMEDAESKAKEIDAEVAAFYPIFSRSRPVKIDAEFVPPAGEGKVGE